MSDPTVLLDDDMQLDDDARSGVGGASTTIDESYLDEDETGLVDEDEEIDELADDDELDIDTSLADVSISTSVVQSTPATATKDGDTGSTATPTAGGAEPKTTAPKVKKPPRKPASERTPGTSLLPASRVTKIMKADKELGLTAKEAVFLVSIATEEFIKRLASEGHKQAVREGRSVVTQKDLATAVKRSDELLFLKEIIPLPVPLATAITKRQAKADGADESDEPLVTPRPTQISAAAASTSTPNSNPTTSTTAPDSKLAPAGALDAFIDRKPGMRKTRLSRGAAAASSSTTNTGSSSSAHMAPPEGLVNGQHTFAVDPSIIERERHPSYYGDFSVPVSTNGNGAVNGKTPANGTVEKTVGAVTRSSGRTSIPSARRAAAAVDEEMDTT